MARSLISPKPIPKLSKKLTGSVTGIIGDIVPDTSHPAPTGVYKPGSHPNPIRVDYRVGSRDLIPKIAALNAPVEEAQLDSGDFEFQGNFVDENNQPTTALIGVERKRIDDLLNSIADMRLVGFQLHKMRSAFTHPYLVVEGVIRRGPQGGVEILHAETNRWHFARGGFDRPGSYERIQGMLHSIHMSGITVHTTTDAWGTAAWAVTLYNWWQRDFLKHESMSAVYLTIPDRAQRRTTGGTILYKDLPEHSRLVWHSAAGIRGMGGKAASVAEHFPTLYEMAMGSRVDWEEAIGKGKLANDAYNVVNGMARGRKDNK